MTEHDRWVEARQALRGRIIGRLRAARHSAIQGRALASEHTRVYGPNLRGSFLHDVRQLWTYRDLLLVLTQRDIKVRYKQSFLGFAWAILQPLSMTLMFTVVFSIFLHVKTGSTSYPVFAYVALLPWTFFANSLALSTNSLVSNANLVSKIYCPREVFPLAAMAASLFDFFVGSTILIGMMIVYHIPLTPWLLLVLPIVVLQIIFTSAVGMILAATMVFLRDLRFVVPLVVQLWMYATPVIYPIASVPARFQTIYGLNPMTGLVESYRQTILLGHAPEVGLLTIAAAFSLVLLACSYRFFKWAEASFADVM